MVRRAWRFLLPLAPVLLLILAAQSSETSRSSQIATPVRQADAGCEKCHAEIFKNYLLTPMANASGLAEDRVFTGSLHHTPSGMDYKIARQDGGLWLEYSRNGDPAVKGRHRLEYFLGSGHLGLTYLYTVNGYFIESPIAYYANFQGLDMKPGLTKTTTLPSALPMTSGCMRCHMSDVQKEDPGTRNHFSSLPFRHAGITCEACHGDSSSHVATAGKAAIINPMKLEPEQRDSVCISCHLEGDTRIEHAGKNVLDYKPGERIADYLSFFVYASDQITSRGVSEIEELALSRCKRSSGDRMSCMSCHDPHYSPPEAKRAAFYRARCLACHTQPKIASEHFPETPDCTSCHLPKGKAGKVPHIAWTNHRIRKQYDEPTEKAEVRTQPELISFLKEKTDSRDLALAYYDVLNWADRGEVQRTWTLLLAAHDAHPQDLPLLNALGYMAQMRGNNSQAIQFYREALKLDPIHPTALNNLAIMLAKAGQLEEAAELWEKTFSLNLSTDEPGINLAAAQCLLGRRDQAISALNQVLLYSPDRKEARDKLKMIESGQDKCSSN